MDLQALLARYRGPLIGLFASRGASPRDAVELAQDVFAEAYLSRDRFRGDWEDPATAGAWLRGIAGRLWLAHGRRSLRLDPSLQRELVPTEEVPAPVQDESAEQLRALIAGLPREWRTVLHLRYVEESGLAEIAGLLGISERAVEGRLHRARKELKQRMEVAAAEADQGATTEEHAR